MWCALCSCRKRKRNGLDESELVMSYAENSLQGEQPFKSFKSFEGTEEGVHGTV